MGIKTAQKHAIKDFNSDSKVNSYFHTGGHSISKITKEPKQKNRLGTASNEITGGGGEGFNYFALDQQSPIVLPWFLRHLVVNAWHSILAGHWQLGKTRIRCRMTQGLSRVYSVCIKHRIFLNKNKIKIQSDIPYVNGPVHIIYTEESGRYLWVNCKYTCIRITLAYI